MDQLETLQEKVKQLMVDNLMLPYGPEEIGNEQPLFGPDSLGLDSVDALQLVVALDKNFGLKIPDQAQAKEILKNVSAIARAIQSKQTR